MPMPDLLQDLSRLSLDQIAQMAADQKLPPVASWHPEKCGHSEMRIARDGRWFHQGDPINRENMVRLFSSILRREADGRHVLVTPSEMLDIDVEDAPFVAVEVKSEGSGAARTLAFRLNTGDLVIAGADHPLRMAGTADAPAPYLAVRGGMEARINRASFYDLALLALEEGADPPGVWSEGTFFSLVPAA
jgi:hypothetical protein